MALSVALGWMLGGAAAAVEIEDLSGWLARTTDLRPSQVAMIGPDSVYSLEPLGAPLPTGEVMVLVRTEPLTDDWRALHGFTSWDANLLIDCPQRRVRVIRSATYPLRNRAGKPTPQANGGQAVTPLRDEPAAQLLAAACDADYAWPLRGARPQRVAAPASPPPAPRPLSQVAPIPAATIPAAAPPAARMVVAAMPTVVMPEAPMQARPAPGMTVSAPAEIVLSSTPAVAPAAREAPPRRAGWTLQLALGPSQEGADRAVKTARKALGSSAKDLVGWTSPSAEGDSPLHAGLLGGFRTFAQASAACEVLKRAGQDCLVQKGPPTPAGDLAAAAVEALPQAAPPPKTHAVQVARGPSEDGARRALAKARKALPSLSADIRDAMPTSRIPGDHIRFDARLEGFANATAASEACQILTTAGQSCFVLAPSGSAGDGSTAG